ncbi:MAG: peptidase M14 [Firmicutes bacterium HGW-Firmicutes-7]|nr:MAG: peptidase M14 [Firmicutes bacterium HGW-Firmicutes-7]
MKESCYTTHRIVEGETLNDIVKKYGSTTTGILTANQTINPFFLKVNSTIIVPISKEGQIVQTNNRYNHTNLKHDLMQLKVLYPFLDMETIGLSVNGREIYMVTFGTGDHPVIYNGAHHGDEWITSLLLMKWLENICFAYANNASMKGYPINELYKRSKIILVPMVNPDGVELVVNGLKSFNNTEIILRMNRGNADFSQWKANVNGVDLNRNYPAGFREYKKIEKKLSAFKPGPSKYAGVKPLSEPETRCISNLTMRIEPRLTLSFHAQGEVIYWQYLGRGVADSLNIASELSKACGYKLENENWLEAFASYKDWFIHHFSKPGFTIKVGLGNDCNGVNQFDSIYEKNEELMLLGSII